MPTHHKAQFHETSMPFAEVWHLMRSGLKPVARQILTLLKFYDEWGTEPSADGEPLSAEEEAELRPLVTALAVAAVLSEEMKPGPLVSTLKRVRKTPKLFCDCALPAAVLWELAQDYQRDMEPLGTFSMDIWGSAQTAVACCRLDPTDQAVAVAAARALARIQQARTPGRPDHPAHFELAERLATVFGKSELEILRKRQIVDCKHGIPRYAERGPFFDFLELVLPPLREFLRERRLAPITSESVVRAAQAHVRESIALHQPSTPDYSHGAEPDMLD